MSENFDDKMRGWGVPQDALDRMAPLVDEDPETVSQNLRLMVADGQAYNARLRAELAAANLELRASAERYATALAERDEARSQAATLRQKLEWVEGQLYLPEGAKAFDWRFDAADQEALHRFLWTAQGEPRQDAGAPLLALLNLALRVADTAQALDDASGQEWERTTGAYTEAMELLRAGAQAYRGEAPPDGSLS